MDIQLPKNRLNVKQIQTQQRKVPVDQIIAVQGQNPWAQGVQTAGDLIGSALQKRAELRRQGEELAKAESLLGLQPGELSGIRDTNTAVKLGEYASNNRKPTVIQQVNPDGTNELLTIPAGNKFGGTVKVPAQQPQQQMQGKQLPAQQVLTVNEGKAVANRLPDVVKTLESNIDLFGPLNGRFASINPYNTRAQTVEADLRSASQAFGRFMEGGVLRKEDEIKYLKMFPQLSDTPDVARNKLQIVQRLLAQKFESDREALGGSGYDIAGFDQLLIPPSPTVSRKNSLQKLPERARQLSTGVITATNKNTGQKIISRDGGKTWQPIK